MSETSKDLSWTLFLAQCVQSLQLMWQNTMSLRDGYFTPTECMRELLRRLRVWLVYSWSSLEFDHGSWETSFFTWWAASRQTKSDNDSVCPDTDTVLGMYVLRNEDMYQTMQSSVLNLGSCLASQQSYWAGSCLTFICHLSLQVESACCKVQQVWARGLELGHDRRKMHLSGLCCPRHTFLS